MDSPTFLDKYYPVLKQHWLPITLGLLGLIFLGYGLIALMGSSNSSKDIIFEAGSDSSLSSDPTSNQDKDSNILVDVEGAVLKPGVYHVAANSRLSDALIAAGGIGEFADRDWLAKNLNLAAKLTDGAKIYIPRIGEEVKGITGSTSTTGITGSIPSGEIDINTASVEMLDTLPGVGSATAQKIINGRPYSSIEELLSRKIVGSKVFEEIKEKISVY